jgi:twinkle protein
MNEIMLKLSNNNYHYLTEKRCLNNDSIAFFKLFNGVTGEICFPYYKNDILVNVKHYIPAKNEEKKKFWDEKECELCLFNQDNIDGNEYLIICEGHMDCISFYQYGLKNVVSVPNGCLNLAWIENDYEFLDKFQEIYLCMDTDAAGQKNIEKIVARLGNWRVKNVILPHKDANDCLMHGVSKEEISKCFEDAEEFGPIEIKTAGSMN